MHNFQINIFNLSSCINSELSKYLEVKTNFVFKALQIKNAANIILWEKYILCLFLCLGKLCFSHSSSASPVFSEGQLTTVCSSVLDLTYAHPCEQQVRSHAFKQMLLVSSQLHSSCYQQGGSCASCFLILFRSLIVLLSFLNMSH